MQRLGSLNWVLGAALWLAIGSIWSCDSDVMPPCGNDTCSCLPGASCEIACVAPPCHIECVGNNPSCGGSCANAECICGVGSSCQLDCIAPPCHVTCSGQNPRCAGSCANGTCTCGPGSHCEFVCQSAPCHVTCAAGSSCSVRCPAGLTGTDNCSIDQCAAGQPVACPDGSTTTCGMPCP